MTDALDLITAYFHLCEPLTFQYKNVGKYRSAPSHSDVDLENYYPYFVKNRIIVNTSIWSKPLPLS